MSVVSQAGKKWRPHAKCHKSPEIGKLLIRHGASGLTCAKVSEAEVFAAAGITDIVQIDAAGTLDVLKGKGDGTFEAAVTYAVGAQPWLPSIGDVDGDGKLDLVVGNLGSGDLSLLRGKGGAAFAVAVTLPGHGRNHATALVDLDDDGDRDLVYASFDDGGVRFRRGKGDGTFEPAIVLAQGAASSVGFALGDMNGDGRPDVCVSQSAAGLLSIFPDASR